MSGEVAFAAELSEDRLHAAIVAAGREKDGPRLIVDLVWYDHPRGVVGRLAALAEKHDPVATVVDPMSQAGTLIRPLSDAGVWLTKPQAHDAAIAHGEFLDLVNDGRLAHLDQPPLTAAVRAAQQRRLAGAQAWERRLLVDQSPLVAATLACWVFRRWEEMATPSTWAI